MQFLVLILVRLLESGSQARDDSGQSHGLTHWMFWKERARQMEKAVDSLQIRRSIAIRLSMALKCMKKAEK